jgi:GT2 family glycosyltransferase
MDLRAAGFQIVPVSELVGQTRAQLMPPLTFRERLVAHADGLIFTMYEWSRLSVAFIFVLGIGLVSCRAIIVGLLAIIEKFRPSPPDHPDFQPLVSVLIPAYNEEDVIVYTVNSVLESDYPKAGSDCRRRRFERRHRRMLDSQFGRNPAVRIMHQPNSGKPAALSHALAEASSSIIVTIDADTAIEPDAISKLVRHFVDPRIGAVAGNVKVGNRISWLTRWQALEYVTSQNLEKRAFDLLNCIPVVPGALSAWRAEAINDSGGFSADTVAEDTDLTITIRRAGWKIDYEEEAIGWTNAPETASALIRQRFRWTFGTLQAFWKHRDTLGRTKYGTLGWIALPNMFLFQLLLPLFSPVIDLLFLGSLALYGASLLHFHAPAAVLHRRGRAALAGLLHRISCSSISSPASSRSRSSARRLVPALAAAAAAFLLSPDDVLCTVPRGDGRRARQIGRLARRRARSSRTRCFNTRSISAMATAGLGAKIWPNWLRITSNSSSPNGNFSTSPSSQRGWSSAIREFSRARSRSSGVKSIPVTCAPVRAAVIATTPVPQATSRTCCPGATPANFTRRAAGIVVSISNGAKFAQPSFCNALKTSNESTEPPVSAVTFCEREHTKKCLSVARVKIPRALFHLIYESATVHVRSMVQHACLLVRFGHGDRRGGPAPPNVLDG